jgi:RNA polymerase sigma-70 factor, ECF subfamily
MDSPSATHATWEHSEEAVAEGVLERLARGEEDALSELMERYWDPLVAYTARRLGSRDAAADVVQSAFVRLWERRHARVSEGSIAAYLYRAARNQVIDEQRRAKVRREWASREVASDRGRVSTPLEETQAVELRAGIRRALDALPPRRREVVELARFHSLSYREIGEVMGISPQTVANQMSAALAQLRTELEPFLDASVAGEGPKRTG